MCLLMKLLAPFNPYYTCDVCGYWNFEEKIIKLPGGGEEWTCKNCGHKKVLYPDCWEASL